MLRKEDGTNGWTIVSSFCNASMCLRAITLEWINSCLLSDAPLSTNPCIYGHQMHLHHSAVQCPFFRCLVLLLLCLITCLQQGSGGAGKSWRSCRALMTFSCPEENQRQVLSSKMGSMFRSSRAGRGLSIAPWTGTARPNACRESWKIWVVDVSFQ